MSKSLQRRWVIAARPIGRPLSADDFRLEEVAVTEPDSNQVQVQTLYLGFDPAQKSWMENIAGYAEPTKVGGLMPGHGIGRIKQSRSPKFAPGEVVEGPLGWQEIATVDAAKLQLVPEGLPPSAALGVAGVTGKTAYFGLLHVGRPKPGDTLLISGAAGAVGSVAGQIGKISGCRVIGIAGGTEKCAWLIDELGFDGAIDYKHEKVRHRLKELCPNGVDVFFDNVGGDILNDGLARLTSGARVVICGGISRYNADPRDPIQMPPGPRNYFNVVFTGATIQGFLVHHFQDYYPVAEQRLRRWISEGLLKYREDVQHGFTNAPSALMRLFEGRNLGKQILSMDQPDRI